MDVEMAREDRRRLTELLSVTIVTELGGFCHSRQTRQWRDGAPLQAPMRSRLLQKALRLLDEVSEDIGIEAAVEWFTSPGPLIIHHPRRTFESVTPCVALKLGFDDIVYRHSKKIRTAHLV